MRGREGGIGLSDETRPTICFLAAPFKMFSYSWATLTCHLRSALCFERTSAAVRLACPTGGTLEGGECLAVPSLSVISNLARPPHVCSGHLDRRDGSAAFSFLFLFFFLNREQSREWYECFPAVPLLTGDDCSHLAESWNWRCKLQSEINLFEAAEFSELVNGVRLKIWWSAECAKMWWTGIFHIIIRMQPQLCG